MVIVKPSEWCPMGFCVDVRCTETGYESTLPDYSTITYYLGETHRVRVPQWPAWCENCKRITMAESYPMHLKELRLLMDAAIRDPNSDAAFILGYEQIGETSEQLVELETFLRSRRKGPQCLTCGSTEITLLQRQGPCLCPDGNHYQVVAWGFADLCIGEEFDIDAEGTMIRR